METRIVQLSGDMYLGRLRALAAWWSLGSSAVDPGILVQSLRVEVSALREAGL